MSYSLSKRMTHVVSVFFIYKDSPLLRLSDRNLFSKKLCSPVFLFTNIIGGHR